MTGRYRYTIAAEVSLRMDKTEFSAKPSLHVYAPSCPVPVDTIVGRVFRIVESNEFGLVIEEVPR